MNEFDSFFVLIFFLIFENVMTFKIEKELLLLSFFYVINNRLFDFILLIFE
jgi:hypothetical protein